MDVVPFVGLAVGASGVGASLYFGIKALARDKPRVDVSTALWTDHTWHDEKAVQAGLTVSITNIGLRPVTVEALRFPMPSPSRWHPTEEFSARGLLTDRPEANTSRLPRRLADGEQATFYFRTSPELRSLRNVTVVLSDRTTITTELSLDALWPITDFLIDIDRAAAAMGYKPGSTAVDDYYEHMQEQYGYPQDKALVLSLRAIYEFAPEGARRVLVEAAEGAGLTQIQVLALFPGAYSSGPSPSRNEALYPTEITVPTRDLWRFRLEPKFVEERDADTSSKNDAPPDISDD